MNKTLTPLHIDRLKREAKRLARNARIPLHEALAQMAKREGFQGWELLIRTVSDVSAVSTPATSSDLKPDAKGRIGPALTAHIKASCIQFIQQINDEDVFRACWNGSIWISLHDVENGKVDVDSFDVLGPKDDGVWSKIGCSMGMTPLLDFDGLPEYFVLDDEDNDGESVVPNEHQEMYNTDVGRAKLAEIAAYSIDGDIADVEIALTNR